MATAASLDAAVTPKDDEDAATTTSSPPAPFIKCCIVEVQPHRAQEFAKLCQTGQSKATNGVEEPGCIRLDVLNVVDEQGEVVHHKFIIYEIFVDEEAYQQHVQKPYSQEIGAFIQSGGVVGENAYVAQKLFLTNDDK